MIYFSSPLRYKLFTAQNLFYDFIFSDKTKSTIPNTLIISADKTQNT